jgi:hypothetical protein
VQETRGYLTLIAFVHKVVIIESIPIDLGQITCAPAHVNFIDHDDNIGPKQVQILRPLYVDVLISLWLFLFPIFLFAAEPK